MNLRTVLYLPEVHTHACLVARDWLLNPRRGEVMILTTPKLQSGKRSSLAQLWRILNQSGLRYLACQVRMTRAYLAAALAESARLVPFSERQNLRPEDLSRLDGVSLHRVVDINDQQARNLLSTFRPAVCAAIFFNQILKQEALGMPEHLALNVHPSLLPAYRGISPVFRVLAHGEEEAGVSVHRMTSKLDFGDVFSQRTTAITPTDSVFSLYRRLAKLGGEALNQVLTTLAEGQQPEVVTTSGEVSRFGAVDRAALREFRRRGRVWFRRRDER